MSDTKSSLINIRYYEYYYYQLIIISGKCQQEQVLPSLGPQAPNLGNVKFLNGRDKYSISLCAQGSPVPTPVFNTPEGLIN